MKINEIYGELMIRDVGPEEIATRMGLDSSLVRRVIRNERSRGYAARHVRAKIAEILDRPIEEIWPPEESVDDCPNAA